MEFPDDLPEHYPEKEAFKTVRELLDSPDTVWLEENSPVLRKNGSFPENPEKLLNLVVLVLESWSNVNIGAYGSSKGLSPEFDKLADNGFLFENFFAVGNRTIEGLAAICIGIPSFNHFNHMTKGSFLSGSLEQNRYKGIGSIFGERGYSTVFLHGESSKTFRQSSLARLAGFQKHLGIEELKIKPGETSGPWGLWDHVMMDRLLEVTESEPEPFLAVWMSLSNHPPYVLPDDTFKTARPGDEDGQFGDTLRYTDHFLGRFFEKAKERDFFKNTVFVITADHCARSISTMESRYRIPLLVYAPGIVAPGVGKEVGSQLGFIPSMLDLLGIGAGHHAMGNSLFDRQAQRFAFLNFAQGYGWVSDNLFFEMDPDGGVTGVFDLDSGESFVGGLSGNREKLLSFLQVGKTMLLRNQFVPAP
ncbi:MAG: LTA synthase family protein [Proteobacteria bacterium]|nr:LTA synthase family protein [Pseudomonadota bacterium]